MHTTTKVASVVLLAACFAIPPAGAEILAMVNYESKPADQLKSLKLSGDAPRREGIAVIDVDPKSPAFGQIVSDIPLDPKTVAHHIFYDRTMTKAYVTALAGPQLQVIDLTKNPYRKTVIETPGCAMGEDLIVDEANKRWYLTCMASARVIVGDVATDKVTGVIELPGTYPHGIAIDSKIDRILVTSTITPDLQKPAETVSVVQASTLKKVGEIKMSAAPSPSGVAPVEVMFVPHSKTPTAVVNNMFGHSLWALVWDAAGKTFTSQQVFDFGSVKAGVPLEIYFNDKGDRMYITTASPGHLHAFDISGGVLASKLLWSTATAEGAHHVGFTKDYSIGVVQNSFINLPKMSDGSITVVELATGKVLATMDHLKNAGYNPNSLVLLPQWNALAGH